MNLRRNRTLLRELIIGKSLNISILFIIFFSLSNCGVNDSQRIDEEREDNTEQNEDGGNEPPSDEPPSNVWTKYYSVNAALWSNYPTVKQINDGGYFLVGSNGYTDWVVKTDSEGNSEWSKSFMSNNYPASTSISHGISSIKELSEGNLIMAGQRVFPSDKNDHHGRTIWHEDVWIFKITNNGEVLWSNEFPYETNILSNDRAISMVTTQDLGNLSLIRSRRDTDTFYWLLKTDETGEKQWIKLLEDQFPLSTLESTSDKGFIIIGTKSSYPILLKLDANGNKEWERSYDMIDGTSIPEGYGISVKELNKGGFILLTTSANQDVFDNNAGYIRLIKTDFEGYTTWTKTYGSDSTVERGYDIKQTKDEGYIFVGETGKNGWVVKIDKEGEILWDYSSSCNPYTSVEQTSDDGFIVAAKCDFKTALIRFGWSD